MREAEFRPNPEMSPDRQPKREDAEKKEALPSSEAEFLIASHVESARLVHAELGREITLGKESAAYLSLTEPKKFAEKAVELGAIEELRPFLERFAGMGDAQMLTEGLKRSRERLRAALNEGRRAA